MARRLSALYWGKSLLDFTTPQQGTERGSVRIRYGQIEQKPKIKHLYLKQVWRGGQFRVEMVGLDMSWTQAPSLSTLTS